MTDIAEHVRSAHRLIDSWRDDIVEMLCDLVKFASVKGPEADGQPFGDEVDKAYRFMMDLAEADGFDTFDADGYGGHIESQGLLLDENGEPVAAATETIGIPVHLDVVPAGDGWTHDPFGGEIETGDGGLESGKIFGRGTTDNKCSVCAVYCAMKALHNAGFVPAKNVRLILGLDEETGWSGMVKYLEKTDVPDFGFSPDAEFPVINGEKGVLEFGLAKKLSATREKGLAVRSIEGGTASNAVPDRARAIIMDESRDGKRIIGKKDAFAEVKDKLSDFRERTNYQITGKGVGKAFEITAIGVAAHAAKPDEGLNAISILMTFLSELNIVNDSVRDFISFYVEHIGFDRTGENLNIAFSDEPSGALTTNAGTITMDHGAAIVVMNVRYPVTFKSDAILNAMKDILEKYDIGIVKMDDKAPIFFPKDAPLITTLMDVYRKNTGDRTSAPIVIGGGTYARAIPNAVAFGPIFPGDEDVMHKADEFISVEHLMKITHIYADAIVRLCSTDFHI